MPVWVAIVLSVSTILLSIVSSALVMMWKAGQLVGSYEEHKKQVSEDIQELVKAISTNNGMQTERAQEIEDLVLKIKSAFESYTGKTVNGVDYRRHS